MGINRIKLQNGAMVDPRMQQTYQENVAAQQAQRAKNEGILQAARDKLQSFGNTLTGVVEGARDYAVPVAQGARALLTGAGEPIITDSMRRDLIQRAEAKGGDSGSLGYEDYGLQTSTPGGRFAGGITDIINDPQAFANAATLGRVSFNRDPETGEYSFGDTKYDFNIADTDTGLGANLLRGINEGGLKGAVSNLLTPSTAAAAETATPTPDASTNLQAGVLPGFTRLKNPNSAPGNYDEFMYRGPDGDIYGSQTYSRMAASGSYKDLFKDYYAQNEMMASGGRVGFQAGSTEEMIKAQEAAASDPALDAIRQQLFGQDYIQDIGRDQGIAQYYSGFGLPSSLQFTQPAVDAPAVDTSTPVVDTGGGGGGQDIITPTDNTFIEGGATLEDAGGVPELGGVYATDYQGTDPLAEEMSEVSLPANLDLIDLGNPTGDPRIVSEEMGLVGGIPDRNRGQIPVDTRVTEDFTRPTMADIAGDIDENLIDRGNPLNDPRIVSEEQGLIGSIPDRGRGEIATSTVTPDFEMPRGGGADFIDTPETGPIEIQDLTTPSNVGDFDITAAPDLSNQTGILGEPPSIALAKDPEGVVDPFGGEYTMSTTVTPEDTEQTIIEKVANFLNLDPATVSNQFKTGVGNLVLNKVLDTSVPILSVIDLIGSPFTKSPEEIAAEEQARQDNIDEAAAITQRLEEEVTPQDIIDDRGRGEIPTRTETEPTPTFEQPRGGGADRDDSPAPSASVSTPTGISSAFGSYSAAPASVGGGDTGGGGGRDSGSSKIVCTMMNESYGFGSFRNKIWLKHSKGLAPEYQKGYHKIFLPLVRLSKNNKILKKMLEHIAVHRTIDIRQEARGKVHLLGRIYRKIFEPICYWVGKYVK